jgi:hypothetical protein
MISNDEQLKAMLERIRQFQAKLAYLEQMEKNPSNFCAAESGFKAELKRMQSEVDENLTNE